jgi:hypothetical protein
MLQPLLLAVQRCMLHGTQNSVLGWCWMPAAACCCHLMHRIGSSALETGLQFHLSTADGGPC